MTHVFISTYTHRERERHTFILSLHIYKNICIKFFFILGIIFTHIVLLRTGSKTTQKKLFTIYNNNNKISTTTIALLTATTDGQPNKRASSKEVHTPHTTRDEETYNTTREKKSRTFASEQSEISTTTLKFTAKNGIFGIEI